MTGELKIEHAIIIVGLFIKEPASPCQLHSYQIMKITECKII